jgi:hypothetical protein
MSIFVLVITWFILVFALFIKTVNAVELDLKYRPSAYQYQNDQKATTPKFQNNGSDAFKNLGADGRKNMFESNQQNKNKTEQKSKRKGKGNGDGKGRGKRQNH